MDNTRDALQTMLCPDGRGIIWNSLVGLNGVRHACLAPIHKKIP